MKTTLQKDIKNYLNNRLTTEARRGFEDRLSTDPFLADAVDGYKMFPSMITARGNKEWLHPGKMVIPAIFISVCLSWLGWWWFTAGNLPEETRLIGNTQVENETNPNSKFQFNPIESVELGPLPIYKPEKKLAIRQQTIRMEKIAVKNVTPIYAEVWQDLKFPVLRQKAIFIHNMKVLVVDTLTQGREMLLPDHIPACFESEEKYFQPDRNFKPLNNQKHYMEKALMLFEKGLYKQSLNELGNVSKRLPDNLNVLFYRALCHYNQENYNSALDGFRSVQNSAYCGFLEEARWYEALCLEKMGQTSKAAEMYHQILEQNGFYGLRAASRLALLSKTE